MARQASETAREAAEMSAQASQEAIDRAQQVSQSAKKAAEASLQAAREATAASRKGAEEAAQAWLGAFEKLLGRGGQTASLAQEVSHVTEELRTAKKPSDSHIDEISDDFEDFDDVPETPKKTSRKAAKTTPKKSKRQANIEDRLESLTRMYAAGQASQTDDEIEEDEIE